MSYTDIPKQCWGYIAVASSMWLSYLSHHAYVYTLYYYCRQYYDSKLSGERRNPSKQNQRKHWRNVLPTKLIWTYILMANSADINIKKKEKRFKLAGFCN